jgi:hypothetical protein
MDGVVSGVKAAADGGWLLLLKLLLICINPY